MRRVQLAAALLVLALTASGQTWLSRYNGPANDEDMAYGIGCDDSGRVYVTGTSWGAGNDVLTIAYGPAGESLWAQRYDGAAHGADEARSMAVRGGRVAVTGASSDAGLFTDFLTVVYSAAGDTQWAALYNGSGNGNDQGLAVTIDNAGNVYAAGYAYAESTSWDFATIKYDTSGARQWVSRFATEFEDFASAIAVDDSGNVYVTGSTGNPYLLTWDYTTAKYNAAGVEQWVKQYNGPAGEDDEPHGIAVDRFGNVYVTGGSLDSTSGLDYATIKYSPAGDTLWVRRLNGPGNGPDEASALALDAAGNVYVTGSSQGAASDMDYATVKYDTDGNLLWAARYDGPASGFDEARSIVTDEAGCVYVTGNSTGSGTRADYATVKYDASGGEVWVNRYDGPASRLDEAVAIVLDPTGGVCVTGGSAGSGTRTDYATVRYQLVGIEEMPSGDLRTVNAPTIVRGVLRVSSDECRLATGGLLDMTGREVLDLRPGANDVSRLAPGVYFVRQASDVRKLVLAD